MVATGVNPFTDIICSRWSLVDGSTEDLLKAKSFRIIDDGQMCGQLKRDGIWFGAAWYGPVEAIPFRKVANLVAAKVKWVAGTIPLHQRRKYFSV